MILSIAFIAVVRGSCKLTCIKHACQIENGLYVDEKCPLFPDYSPACVDVALDKITTAHFIDCNSTLDGDRIKKYLPNLSTVEFEQCEHCLNVDWANFKLVRAVICGWFAKILWKTYLTYLMF
jgi:hypothetical protein